MDIFFRHAINAVAACKDRGGVLMSMEELAHAMGFNIVRHSEATRARLKALGIIDSKIGQGGGYFVTDRAAEADLRDLWHMIYGQLQAMEYAYPLVDFWAGLPVELPIPIKGVER